MRSPIPLPDRLQAEWSPRNGALKPSDVSRGSTRKVWWKCAHGHEWEVSPNARYRTERKIRGCPVCAGTVVRAGINDLATTHPVLSRDFLPARGTSVTPKTVSAGSSKIVSWKCRKCHHVWEAAINNRALYNSGCPVCHGNEAAPGRNTLDTLPAVARLWHPTRNAPRTPEKTRIGSTVRTWWKCSDGHVWEATVFDVVRSFRSKRSDSFGCAICSQQKGPARSRGTVLQEFPHLVAQWHPTLNDGISPDEVTAGSEKKVWWQCSEHSHAWRASVKSRARGTGCPYCAHKKVLPGFNDLATRYPRIAAQWHPTLNGSLTPSDVVAFSRKKVHWLCENGHSSYGSPQAKNLSRTDGPITCAECFQQRHSAVP